MSASLPRGTLLFFSNSTPTEGSGSFVVFRRHFLPLVEAGWRLTLLSYFPPPTNADVFWHHVRIPFRRWFWPPLVRSAPRLVSLRARLAAQYLARSGAFHGDSPRVMLTNLWDGQALIAAAAAGLQRLPLGVFVHDDEIAWNIPKEPRPYLEWKRRTVLRAAGCIWPVSHRLANSLGGDALSRCHVLRPIPGSSATRRAVWRADFGRAVHLGYAGKMYPGLWPLLNRVAAQLRTIDGEITVVTDEATVAQHAAVAPLGLNLRPFFPSAAESTDWLRGHCSALLVAYPAEGDGDSTNTWAMLRSSFPSKLPEYAQLGLPLVLVGDPNSEFADWAREHPELPFFGPHDAAALGSHLQRLQDLESWTQAAAVSARLAATEFDPASMQQAFVEDLHRLSASSSIRA